MSRIITLLVIVALTSACASQRKPAELTDIPNNTTVHLNVQRAESKLPDASSDGGTYAKKLGVGALAGAGMGAVMGFSMGIACGPAIVICGPIGAIGGAMGGTVFGLGAGTISAASLQLPQKKAEAFDVVIAQTLEDLDLTEEVSISFRDSGASHWHFVEEGAVVEIQIVLEGIGLEKLKKDQVTISMAISLTIRRGAGETATTERRAFNTTSAAHHIDYWIDRDGDNFREQMQFQASRHAQNMYAELHTQNWGPVDSGLSTRIVPVSTNVVEVNVAAIGQ